MALCSAPVLALPDYSKPFYLCTDACGHGLSGVLTQRFPLERGTGYEERTIGYVSCMISAAELKWHIRELECLAVIWSLRKFREYTEGCEIIVVTDHSALKWLQDLENPIGRLGRWVLEIQHLTLSFVHRPGVKHCNADVLSRFPSMADPEDYEQEIMADQGKTRSCT